MPSYFFIVWWKRCSVVLKYEIENFRTISSFLKLLCLVGMVVHQPFSLFLRPHICIVNLCAQWRTSIYSLYVPTVTSRIQSSFDHIFISPWLELKWQLYFVTYSVRICVNRSHWLHCPCAMQRFLSWSYTDQDPAVKFTNQGQAKLTLIRSA